MSLFTYNIDQYRDFLQCCHEGDLEGIKNGNWSSLGDEVNPFYYYEVGLIELCKRSTLTPQHVSIIEYIAKETKTTLQGAVAKAMEMGHRHVVIILLNEGQKNERLHNYGDMHVYSSIELSEIILVETALLFAAKKMTY